MRRIDGDAALYNLRSQMYPDYDYNDDNIFLGHCKGEYIIV